MLAQLRLIAIPKENNIEKIGDDLHVDAARHGVRRDVR
jgi:hypothetical protein